jgi:hypothetical protein
MITSGLNVLISGGGFMAAIMITLQKSSVKFGNVITKLKQEKTYQIYECKMESMRFEVIRDVKIYLNTNFVLVKFEGYKLMLSHRRHIFHCWFLNNIP